MAAHMGVQRHATRRSEQVEILVDFVLQEFAARLHEEGYTKRPGHPIPRMSFQRADCSDIFDHYMELDIVRSVGGVQGKLHLWAQTTCYKGNESGRPEPNKTYEIRETLVESLGLRRWLREEGETFRTLHFTIGPADYTYGWFPLAKDNAFDLSLYPDPGVGSIDVFDELSETLDGADLEYEQCDRLKKVAVADGSGVGALIRLLSARLYEWFIQGLSMSPLANQQAELLTKLAQERNELVDDALQSSRKGGMGIKSSAIKLLEGDEQTDDPVMQATLRRLARKKPFLQVAMEAEANWDAWSQASFGVPHASADLASYVNHLWQAEEPARAVNRRLLLRIHTDESIHYIQDVGIEGISEHNLYSGDHSPDQATQIVEQIVSSCEATGVSTPEALYRRLRGNTARQLLRAARRFEVRNGTWTKQSFFYVEEALMATGRYSLEAPSRTSIARPLAYHHAFGDATVRSYTNLRVVVDKKTKQPLAIIKAKFFREPEFPRRVKEEAYVGLTIKYEYEDGVFRQRYEDIPLIMFVDMARSLHPPEYAVRRLVTAGWDVFFSIDELRGYLDQLPRRRASSQDDLDALPLFGER